MSKGKDAVTEREWFLRKYDPRKLWTYRLTDRDGFKRKPLADAIVRALLDDNKPKLYPW